MIDATTFAANVLLELPYSANDQQVAVIAALARFCLPEVQGIESVFVLNGYAGTGKTSMIGALVRVLSSIKTNTVLMAPTGRAAKVFSANSRGRQAWTIHRKIYRHIPQSEYGFSSGFSGSTVKDNNHKNTIFIVDEASMIGNGDDRGGNLLEDLIHYVYTGENCRLILMGDTAQLPPVGSLRSPAMNPDILRGFGLKVTRATLTETARQSADSGILFNATGLRRAMLKLSTVQNGTTDTSTYIPRIRTTGFDDVTIVSGEDLPDILDTAYNSSPAGETILITRSNKRAVEYNHGIRNELFYREEEIVKGDMLIVAKNHYFSKGKPKGMDFVANGDILSVERVYGIEMKYGMRFADLSLSLSSSGTAALPGCDNQKFEETEEKITFDAKILLDTLHTDAAALSQEQSNSLYYSILGDPNLFSHDTPVDIRLKSLRNNPHWNALQVKYAYAVTCHKAQGGQWQNVFVDLSYIPSDAIGLELYRWLYTAVTRATKHLYLIAPPEELTASTISSETNWDED